jgi:hypothetical protein
MNKNFKVITINGIRGMLVAIFIVLGLIAGFVISPGWLCMQVWNYFMAQSGNFITMNLLQGIMLWSIIALSLYAINNKRPLIGFGSYPGLSPDQIKDIMSRAKDSEDKIRNEIELLNKELQINKSSAINSDNQNKNDDSVNKEEEVKGHM